MCFRLSFTHLCGACDIWKRSITGLALGKQIVYYIILCPACDYGNNIACLLVINYGIIVMAFFTGNVIGAKKS